MTSRPVGEERSLVGGSALHLCYDEIREPLVENQVIAYLVELARRGVAVNLITFEKRPLDGPARASIRADLLARGIQWRPLRYHRRPSLPATLFDVVQGFLVARGVARRAGARIIHARSHVAGAMGWLLSRSLGVPLLFDLRGLLAEEYVDSGNWRSGGLKYRLTKALERHLFRSAHAIVMLTDTIRKELSAAEPALRRPDLHIEVIPCCVDTSRFRPRSDERKAERSRRGWDGRRVLTYVGKLGGWYPPADIARFFAVAREADPAFFLEVATPSDADSLVRELQVHRVPPQDYHAAYVPPSSLPRLLAASDAGVSLVLPSCSKRASSPTKVGEYLATGLPVLSSAGIGDGDALLAGNRVGVVVSDRSEAGYRRAALELQALMGETEIGARCRAVAERELSLTAVGGPRYAGVYSRLLERALLP